ncbi:hypothetical protein PsorP6_005851 [Peronosclerospora sorghi]|uniref:Uncharacterized protein n=1 Tax=Peronosclerospora sorghi TaxID=230839 RepID=A0ACC0W6N1_9STRA|nr:hypothetical protein PsorP6_005851 [Peronosclerospora sorghi]
MMTPQPIFDFIRSLRPTVRSQDALIGFKRKHSQYEKKFEERCAVTNEIECVGQRQIVGGDTCPIPPGPFHSEKPSGYVDVNRIVEMTKHDARTDDVLAYQLIVEGATNDTASFPPYAEGDQGAGSCIASAYPSRQEPRVKKTSSITKSKLSVTPSESATADTKCEIAPLLPMLRRTWHCCVA